MGDRVGKPRALRIPPTKLSPGPVSGASLCANQSPCLLSQIRTGTPTSTGLRLGERTTERVAWVPNHPNQRRRADSSPSSRAAFSRADMARLPSFRASVMSVSNARVHAQSPPGDRRHGLPSIAFPPQAWRAHLRVAQRARSSHRSRGNDPPGGRAGSLRCFG
jgi:hypothetical protein